MTYILKNKDLEIHIDSPLESYNFTRFDWTGKITKVKFQDTIISSKEREDNYTEHSLGKGFYNEFGFDSPLGFKEAIIGDWFHKIGVGALKKNSSTYKFNKIYEVKPAKFSVTTNDEKLIITCISELINGYAYLLKKEIKLCENGFSIHYDLENTGEKDIVTDEYVHNFISIGNDFISPNYELSFPFQLKPSFFDETVNPENKVEIGLDTIKFNNSIELDFFFSYLSGNTNDVTASWELINLKNRIGISETGNFKTDREHIWGSKHVICPELFFKIDIKSGQSTKWTRNYKVYNI